MNTRWRVLVFTIAVLCVLNGFAAAQILPLPLPPLPQPIVSTAAIDPILQQMLQTASLGQIIEAVLTFDHVPTAADLSAVTSTGVDVARFSVLPMIGVRGTNTQILALLGLSGLRSAYANRQLSYFLNQSVPLIGADRVWNELGITGKGVTIAVIDTGIDATHPDLPYGEKVIQNVKIAPDLFGTGSIVVEGLANTDTTSGHGTHVSSIAAGTGAALAGKYRGVAPGAKLVGVGAGDVIVILSALEGFDWVLANRARYAIRIISNSWGTTGSFSADDPINVASKMAHDAGMTVVFAAGNSGPATNTLNPYCVAPWVICVAAGAKDGKTLADFSSRGIPADALYHPTITAPGVSIAAARATTGIFINTFFAVDLLALGTDAIYYAVASGTSMATPHVAGTAALMLEANPGLTPDGVKALLQTSATPMPGYAVHEVGAGYLNAYNAVTGAIRPSVTRVEDNDPSITYTSNWVSGSDPRASGGGYTEASAAGERATLTFTGTGVTWIGFRYSFGGIARVYVDGVFAAEVDAYAATEPEQAEIFSSAGLAPGTHTLAIEVTGTHNPLAPSSSAYWIVVDAFDVTH
ncbi:MAG: peptidase S8 [Bacillati bacterium ANGP1]|uniref:Peptidase S8 n=1 Tax=Candidatus Segetimicrobium genomatis TaxID=2569760 RepID=A0A537ISE1_9BACT|nr:MAG: peptidase S8 [Terrabacteria group bacterium ANGP1]